MARCRSCPSGAPLGTKFLTCATTTRRVLGKLAACKDIVVINDEAHHAYRKPADVKISKRQAEELGIDLDEATRWIDGLDRIHKTRRTTRAMRAWYTTKLCHPTRRSQISHMLADSAWEQHAANLFERSDQVAAYAKNDHLGFQIYYLWNGARRRYVPDFLIRLANGKTLVLEIKGEDSEQNRAKRAVLDAWVQGVNSKGGFGPWCRDVAFEPAQIQDLIARHGK